MLKVSPKKGVIRFGKGGKLTESILTFQVVSKSRNRCIQTRTSSTVKRVHSPIHVSNLKKCLSDESLVIPLDEIHIDDKLHFIEEPAEIMDREVKRLKQSRIPIIKPLSLSFDFVFLSEIFKSLSFCLDRLCHLAILCLDQHAHTLHHLESLLTISLDRLDIFEGRSCISEFVRKSLSLILELS
ncbi:hypothetical protein Tco_1561311 [Tanacetum coccineum]